MIRLNAKNNLAAVRQRVCNWGEMRLSSARREIDEKRHHLYDEYDCTVQSSSTIWCTELF